MGFQRLFVAIPLEPEVKGYAEGLQIRMRKLGQLKWTPIENFHLTLVFLGNVGENDLEELMELLAEVADEFSPFTMQASQAGPSPGKGQNPMVWIHFRENEYFTALALKLRRQLEEYTEKPDERPPLAHLTLARPGLKPPRREDIPLVEAADCPPIRVSSIELWKSVPGQGGSVYSSLKSWPLKG